MRVTKLNGTRRYFTALCLLPVNCGVLPDSVRYDEAQVHVGGAQPAAVSARADQVQTGGIRARRWMGGRPISSGGILSEFWARS